VQRHEIAPRDEHLHLVQQLVLIAGLLMGAVEDHEDVVSVGVQLGALPEVQRILERQRMKAEQLAQLLQLSTAWTREVEPEELIAGEVTANGRLVDRVHARHRAGEAVDGSLVRLLGLRLADRHLDDSTRGAGADLDLARNHT
jgi:hypothetical protein